MMRRHLRGRFSSMYFLTVGANTTLNHSIDKILVSYPHLAICPPQEAVQPSTHFLQLTCIDLVNKKWLDLTVTAYIAAQQKCKPPLHCLVSRQCLLLLGDVSHLQHFFPKYTGLITIKHMIDIASIFNKLHKFVHECIHSFCFQTRSLPMVYNTMNSTSSTKFFKSSSPCFSLHHWHLYSVFSNHCATVQPFHKLLLC